jgi:hypothetical protein
LKIKYSSIGIFVGGLLLGALAQYGIPEFFPSPTEQKWRSEHSEESSHVRIMAFQQALKDQGVPKDAASLKQQLDLQMEIEQLVIQSRDAEYSNLIPFTSLSSSFGGLLIALLGFVAGLIGKKRGAKTASDA